MPEATAANAARAGTSTTTRTQTDVAASAGTQVRNALDGYQRAEADRDLDPRWTDLDNARMDGDDAPADPEYSELDLSDQDEEPGQDLPEVISATRRRPAAITVWWAGTGVLTHIREPHPALLRDPELIGLYRKRHERLEAYATWLRTDTAMGAVVRAQNLREAYNSLPIRTFEAVSALLFPPRAASQLSRDRNLVIGLPAGQVPWDFIQWKDRGDAIVLAVRDAVTRLGADASHAALQRDACTLLGERGTQTSVHTVRPYVPWVLAVVDQPAATARFRSWFGTGTLEIDTLIGDFGITLTRSVPSLGSRLYAGRGTAVLRRALVGDLT